MSPLLHIWIVSVLNFKGLRQRLWQSMVIVVGMGLVIGVLLSMLAMTEGLHQAYLHTGDPSSVFVVSAGSQWEGASSIPRDQMRIILDAPGIARAADGSPMADPGLAVGVPVQLLKNGAQSYASLRGFGPKGVALRPTFRMVAGRMFRSGRHELIVGASAENQFQGMAIGDKVILPDGPWPIVGSFTTGDLLDGQLVGDTATLMLAIRHPTYSSALVRIANPKSFATFRHALTSNPVLEVDVMYLADWNQKTSAPFSTFFNDIAYGTGIILAIGALFGCFNTMYAAVSARTREIATLRALGYSGFAVAASVILEAVALSVTGALIAAAIVWWRYDGVQDGFGSDVFSMTVSPSLIGIAILWAVAVALIGGAFPSIRAARLTIVDALRAT